MIKRNKSIYLGIFMCLGIGLLTSCKKLLEVNQQNNKGIVTPTTVDDFEQLLNSVNIYAMEEYNYLNLFSDDRKLLNGDLISNGESRAVEIGFYKWQANIWGRRVDLIYTTSYRWLAQMNILIDGMPQALPAGQDERRAIAIARAKINRAFLYHYLVNIYGAAYQKATAGTDLGVPLLLHLSLQSQGRATVQQVYHQIINDLQDALNTPALPDLPRGLQVIDPGKGEAWALLARVHLYMGNYLAAQAAATEALNINSQLLDYRTFKPPGNQSNLIEDDRPISLFQQQNNPEIFTARVLEYFEDNHIQDIHLDPELVGLFEPKDMRFLATTHQNKQNGWYAYIVRFISLVIDRGRGMGVNYSLAVPEMMLIKAECLARNNDATAAIKLLNALRVYRFKKEDYKELTIPTNAETALRLVLDERRRELMFKPGLRMFDLKRLNLDLRFKKDLVRKNEAGETIAMLPAGDKRYQIQFSMQQMAGNPLLVQNP